MHYHQIIRQDTANGPGLRVSLFVSGCDNACPGCHNLKGQDFRFGWPFTDQTKDGILGEFRKFPLYEGLSVLGGEPLHPLNVQCVADLCLEFKREFPDKTIWVYTGYAFEELSHDGDMDMILHTADVLVDGPFLQAKRNLMLSFRGSANQRIIDLKETMRTGRVATLDETYDTY